MLLLPDLYAFYVACTCSAWAGSYLNDSGFGALVLARSGVDLRLGFRCFGLLAGGCPAATYLFIASPKKSRQKKGDPAVRVPALRFGRSALPRKNGGRRKLAALKQRAALIPCLRGITGPDRTGRAGAGTGTGTGTGPGAVTVTETDMAYARRRWLFHSYSFSPLEKAGMRASGGRTQTGQEFSQPPVFQSSLKPAVNSQNPHPSLLPEGKGASPNPARSSPASDPDPASPVLTGPVMTGKSGIRAARCLSRRRVCADPRFCHSSQVARSAAQGPRQPGRLSFAYFSLAKQRKVSYRRATPGQQTQAKPATAKVRIKTNTEARP